MSRPSLDGVFAAPPHDPGRIMGYVLRQALAVLALPFTVAVVIPLWIARRVDGDVALPGSWSGWLVAGLGLAILCVGAALFVSCLGLFGARGRGTLAPWDPPRKLVTEGPYAYVRNPMISGVVLVLIGEGLLLRSLPHLVWAAGFALLNTVYIPLSEEQGLRNRFGAEYDAYATHVPRLIPRLTPWRGP